MDDFEVDAALQAALDRLTLLNQAAAVLSSTLDAVEGLRRVCRVLVPALADWCVADLVDDQGGVERVSITHRDGEVDSSGPARTPAVMPQTASGPLSRVLRGAGPLLLSAEQVFATEATGDRLHALDRELLARLGGETLIVAPLRARRRVLGALTVVRDTGRVPLDEADRALLEDLTHRIALAVDNSRLYAETEAVAERLQRSLLPDLPVVDALRITARYTPAAATAQIGGDWYDSFALPQGDTTLIIGDVTGHDLRAAVTMSQVRNMLRGIACDRQEPPGMILRRLDTAIGALYPHQTATCVYALLKGPEGGPYHLEWSRAGHPPPLLISAEGDTRYLEGAHGMLLGVDPQATRDSASTPLPPGSTLLLYTDGLIERRGEPLNHSLTRLRQHAAALVEQDLEVLCDELLAGLAADSHDDVALLSLRLPPRSG
ncbi:PP2C family protein-serine/threonine phosphatase [Streptomyces odonnellii]|uniref:PP2C family protein-serine/threonine phosphatase n=1 Tax=Streptomyces odonnellii TaxID=1417980 RepID=UPI000625E8A8|nr:GAF domain-containing SpoIIE family protein phosphatase [Streptomyces odonnellii]